MELYDIRKKLSKIFDIKDIVDLYKRLEERAIVLTKSNKLEENSKVIIDMYNRLQERIRTEALNMFNILKPKEKITTSLFYKNVKIAKQILSELDKLIVENFPLVDRIDKIGHKLRKEKEGEKSGKAL